MFTGELIDGLEAFGLSRKFVIVTRLLHVFPLSSLRLTTIPISPQSYWCKRRSSAPAIKVPLSVLRRAGIR